MSVESVPAAHGGAGETGVRGLAPPRTPYRGIEPFRVIDEPIFFERTREAQRLLRMVTIYRGVLLYGDSGVGKSSLVNAKFIPLCLKEALVPERLAVQPRPGEEIVLKRIMAGEGMSSYLPSLLARPDETGAQVVLSAAELLKRVRRLSRLGKAASGAGAGNDGPDAAPEPRPVLVFDQFEEFVTLFEEAPPAEAARAHAAVLKLLSRLLRSEKIRVKVVFVFREDYLAKLAPLFERAPDLPDHFLRLTPLHVGALHDIIRGPFEHQPGLFAHELSPALSAKLERALAAQSEQGVLNLSQVQIACLRLWEAPDPDALFATEGVEGLLRGYLEDALRSLPEELRDPALLVLTRLVTSAGTRNVVSKDDLARKLDDADPPEEVLARAVDALEKTALVRRELRHDSYIYEIASEFLVPWIYRKRTDRRVLAEKRAVQEAEDRKRRKAYRVAAALAVLGVAGAAVYSSRLSVQARAQQFVQQAEAGRTEALTRYREKNDELDSVKTVLTRVDTERDTLAVRVQGVERMRDSLSRVASQQAMQLDTTSRALVRVRAEAGQLRGDLLAARQEATRLGGLLGPAQAEVTRLRGELATANLEVRQLRADTARLRREATRLHADTTRLRRERNRWRDSVQVLTGRRVRTN